MLLPMRYNPKPTSVINDGNKSIPIDDLPNSIREEFYIIDNIKEEMAKHSYQLELLTLALKQKSQEIALLVQKHLARDEENPQ